jgi:hypothetical protein
MRTRRQTATSNVRSANFSACASPRWKFTLTPASSARCRATSSIASEASTAVTRAPPSASINAARPVPVPTSMIVRSLMRPIMFASTRACVPATSSPMGPPKRRSSKDRAIPLSAYIV